MMHGMTGVPKVLDRSKIIRPDGSSLAQLPVLDCVELLAPLVEAVGHEETSGFKAMAEALGAGDTTVSTVAFRHRSVGSGTTQRHATHERGQVVPAGAPGVGDHRKTTTRRLARASGTPDPSAGYSSSARSHSVGNEHQQGGGHIGATRTAGSRGCCSRDVGGHHGQGTRGSRGDDRDDSRVTNRGSAAGSERDYTAVGEQEVRRAGPIKTRRAR